MSFISWHDAPSRAIKCLKRVSILTFLLAMKVVVLFVTTLHILISLWSEAAGGLAHVIRNQRLVLGRRWDGYGLPLPLSIARTINGQAPVLKYF